MNPKQGVPHDLKVVLPQTFLCQDKLKSGDCTSSCNGKALA
jgi:hypothetical protein